MALVTSAVVLGILVTLFVTFHIIKEGGGGAEATCPQAILSCHKWLANTLPLSAIKIAVVVFQIITQVGVGVRHLQRNGCNPETYEWQA